MITLILGENRDGMSYFRVERFDSLIEDYVSGTRLFPGDEAVKEDKLDSTKEYWIHMEMKEPCKICGIHLKQPVGSSTTTTTNVRAAVVFGKAFKVGEPLAAGEAADEEAFAKALPLLTAASECLRLATGDGNFSLIGRELEAHAASMPLAEPVPT